MKKLNQYQRAKLNKILLIIAIMLCIVAIGFAIGFFVTKNNKKEEAGYEDNVVAKNLFVDMSINLNTREVIRDSRKTTLQEEFGLTAEQSELLYSSSEQMKNFFANSTFEANFSQGMVFLKNPYQTKTLIVEADEIRDNFDATEEIQIQEGLYLLKYDSQKRTKAAYEYITQQAIAKNIQVDEVLLITPINDESQTMYGQNKTSKDSNQENVYGVSAMGLNNYKKIINDNGSASDVVIATIGYGAAIDNTYFNGRISEEHYNYIDDSTNIEETIPQGSRVLEVIKESTPNNVKILPLVVINKENYTTTSAILRAISLATQKSDVICYEFLHKQDYMIQLALKNAFNKNVPICCVTKSAAQEDEAMFPANDGTTIAVSSVDKDLKTTSYSSVGDYIDFVASSTDIKEIFNSSSSVSKWSGAHYSNAQIASVIALIKTYNKTGTILDIYNTIKSYCEDLGEKGKDSTFGYGFPNFSKIKISDIDKANPNFEDLVVDDNEWQKSKKVQIKANDNIKIFGWNVQKTDKVPNDWKTSNNVQNTLNMTEEIDDNGKYYVWVVDTAGNAVYKEFEIKKIDKTAPTIKYSIDESHIEKEKYVNVNISATDEQSGLHDLPYSWDNLNWGINNTTLKVTENGTYTLYVRDKLGNTTEKNITIKSLPEKGTAEIDNGLIIKDISVSDKWEGNTNKEVTITFNDNLNIKRRKITDADIMPEEFRPKQSEEENTSSERTTVNETNTINETVVTTVEDNGLQGYTNLTVTVSLEVNKKYYIWVEDINGNIISQGFMIKR